MIRHAIFLIQLDVPHCSKILPTTAIGRPRLAWPWPNEAGQARPHGLMAAPQSLPEPMPIDTFSPSFNFCQKSLIQFLKLYNRSHSILNIDVSWDYCSKILLTTTLCLPWPTLTHWGRRVISWNYDCVLTKALTKWERPNLCCDADKMVVLSQLTSWKKDSTSLSQQTFHTTYSIVALFLTIPGSPCTHKSCWHLSLALGNNMVIITLRHPASGKLEMTGLCVILYFLFQLLNLIGLHSIWLLCAMLWLQCHNTSNLSICTWFLKNQVGKIKLDELDF